MLRNFAILHFGFDGTLAAIETLTKIGSIATMNSSHERQAHASGNADFEHELQIANATSIPELSAIITHAATLAG